MNDTTYTVDIDQFGQTVVTAAGDGMSGTITRYDDGKVGFGGDFSRNPVPAEVIPVFQRAIQVFSERIADTSSKD